MANLKFYIAEAEASGLRKGRGDLSYGFGCLRGHLAEDARRCGKIESLKCEISEQEKKAPNGRRGAFVR
jgi:hypothetical protein